MRKPQVLVVDDEADIRNTIQEILAEEGYDVATAADAGEARSAVRERAPDLVLLDVWMPDTDGISLLGEWQQGGQLHCPVVILSGHGTVETAVEATRLGAVDFVEKPVSLSKLLRTVERALTGKRPVAREGGGRGTMPPLFAALGRSRRIRELRAEAERLAPHNAPVLIVGESGTGRGALARFMHESGPRREQPFVTVVGASLIADNAANLLLGAADAQGTQAGCIERAAGGSLFISNIEQASVPAQDLLAGIMEAGSFARLGHAGEQRVTARLMASARPETIGAPAASGLRPELLERLGALRIHVPPVREYSQDMSELLRYLTDDLSERDHLPYRPFSFAAQNRLRTYPWPENLRQLTGLVRRVLAAGLKDEVSLAEVERELPPAGGPQQPLVKQDLLALPLREAREQFERAYLVEQLALCGGKVGQLAKRVGMERTHLYRKLRSLGVEFRNMPGDE
ncbi:MAG: sigma-54 dependent transcriptional regulator [Gammaproteobacteria bacterium]|nr:MAG: sigma-54 dependent transcriptional regulator [Gammaproteobacteria bacterium]